MKEAIRFFWLLIQLAGWIVVGWFVALIYYAFFLTSDLQD